MKILDESIKQHVVDMNKLKQFYSQSEADKRMKAAVRGRANSILQQLDVGDLVKYYRHATKKKNNWRGPAKIIRLDGNCVTIKHGGSTIQPHHRDVRKVRTTKNFKMTKMDQNATLLMRNDSKMCDGLLISNDEFKMAALLNGNG